MDRALTDTYRRTRAAIISTLEQAEGPVCADELDAAASKAANVSLGNARNARFRLVSERTITNLDRIDGAFYVLGSELTGTTRGPKTRLERRMVDALRDRWLTDVQAGQAVSPKVPPRVARDVLEGLVRRRVLGKRARPHDVRYGVLA